MTKKDMEVVKGLNTEKYMGRWYEIASLASLFQPKGGGDTRATYTLNSDGTLRVLNETWIFGKRIALEASAYKADPKSDEAKLKVKSYEPPFLPIFPVIGDYWVLDVDKDYQYSLVGEPRRKFLWILGRQTSIDEKTYNIILDKAKGEGYDVSKVKRTGHSATPPEAPDNKGIQIGWIKSIFGK